MKQTPSKIANFAKFLKSEWGEKPKVILSCEGGTDEHWQFWHEDDCFPGGMPIWVAVLTETPVGKRYIMKRHPDGRKI